jgi:hypothetical protein
LRQLKAAHKAFKLFIQLAQNSTEPLPAPSPTSNIHDSAHAETEMFLFCFLLGFATKQKRLESVKRRVKSIGKGKSKALSFLTFSPQDKWQEGGEKEVKGIKQKRVQSFYS